MKFTDLFLFEEFNEEEAYEDYKKLREKKIELKPTLKKWHPDRKQQDPDKDIFNEFTSFLNGSDGTYFEKFKKRYESERTKSTEEIIKRNMDTIKKRRDFEEGLKESKKNTAKYRETIIKETQYLNMQIGSLYPITRGLKQSNYIMEPFVKIGRIVEQRIEKERTMFLLKPILDLLSFSNMAIKRIEELINIINRDEKKYNKSDLVACDNFIKTLNNYVKTLEEIKSKLLPNASVKTDKLKKAERHIFCTGAEPAVNTDKQLELDFNKKRGLVEGFENYRKLKEAQERAISLRNQYNMLKITDPGEAKEISIELEKAQADVSKYKKIQQEIYDEMELKENLNEGKNLKPWIAGGLSALLLGATTATGYYNANKKINSAIEQSVKDEYGEDFSIQDKIDAKKMLELFAMIVSGAGVTIAAGYNLRNKEVRKKYDEGYHDGYVDSKNEKTNFLDKKIEDIFLKAFNDSKKVSSPLEAQKILSEAYKKLQDTLKTKKPEPIIKEKLRSGLFQKIKNIIKRY